MRKNTLSKKDHYDLACKADNEGVSYYLMHYGPDMEAIEKLGFKKEEVDAAIKLFSELENAIMEGLDFYEDGV